MYPRNPEIPFAMELREIADWFNAGKIFHEMKAAAEIGKKHLEKDAAELSDVEIGTLEYYHYHVELNEANKKYRISWK